jgi:hypothetical protein
VILDKDKRKYKDLESILYIEIFECFVFKFLLYIFHACLLNTFQFKSIINFASVIIVVASEASTNNNTVDSKSRSSKISCEICGLLFDTVDIKEEHKKLEHIEHKRPSGVG